MKAIENNLNSFGKRIRYIRKNLLDLTIEGFANKYHLPIGTFKAWESNKRQKLSEAATDKLLTAFQAEGVICSESWLRSGKGKQPTVLAKEPSSKIPFNPLLRNSETLLRETLKNQQLHRLNLKLFEVLKKRNTKKEVLINLINKGANAHLIKSEERVLYEHNENSPLHFAIKNSGLSLAETLITRGNEVNCCNKHKETPLHWACYSDELKANSTKLLLKNGANTNATDIKGRSPLAWACYHGKLQTVIDLIEHHADIELSDINGNAPIHWAAISGKIDIIKLLTQKGANISKANKEGLNSLDLAVKLGQTKTIRFFLDHFE